MTNHSRRVLDARPSGVCADCGLPVELLSTGQWGERVRDCAWSMACRTQYDDGRLIHADYHYVAGEDQRHFEKPT